MKEQNIAKAYARSIISLGKEMNVNVADELTTLNETINVSNDLENVLYLDVFTVEEKTVVYKEIANKLSLSSLVKNFGLYLVSEKRMNLFSLIYKEVVVLDDHEKGFIRGVVEGAENDVDTETLAKIKSFLKDKLGKEPELVYTKSDRVSAGYRVTVEDLQLDASLDNQLEQFKHSVLGE